VLALAAALAPGRSTGASTAEPLAFGTLPWGVSPPTAASWLGAHGFVRRADGGGSPAWIGRVFGRRARVSPEFASERLVAVTVRFTLAGDESADQAYADVAARARRRHGPWAYRVEPGRPVTEERTGRWAGTRRFGPRTAASLWTSPNGEAAVVQLDGAGALWLRYEAAGWEEAARRDAQADSAR
jgi:hypothetical protein